MTESRAEQVQEAMTAAEALLGDLKHAISVRKLEQCYAAPHPNPGGPYGWQMEFHEAGAMYRQRMIQAGNRSGKSYPAGAETALHLTGLYPAWWKGHRFTRPIKAWVCGPRNEDLQKGQQKFMLGEIEEGKRPNGTGWIPLELIGPVTYRQAGTANVIDEVRVKHVSGASSVVGFKSFAEGPDAFQIVEIDWAWLDEEPKDPDKMGMMLNQIIIRTMTTNGHVIFTRTALDGLTAWIQHFRSMEQKGIAKIIRATWDDAKHLSAEQKRVIWESTPEHLQETVRTGEPTMGTGLIFNVPDSSIKCDPFSIPSHFRRIAGTDFGIDHPAAGVWLAHDTDTDTIYVYDCYRIAGHVAAYHADAIKSRGEWIPVAWPHDGMVRDKGGGEVLASQYRNQGANMLEIHAQYDNEDRNAVEPGLMDILGRMKTGRFKVFSNLSLWFEEKRQYHRKDGLVVKINDDLMAATRYAVMMLRCALSNSEARMPLPAHAIDAGDWNPLAEFSR